MPTLICASHRILDQSFPRNAEELAVVAIALGELENLVQADVVHLALTEGLQELVEMFDWDRPGPYPLLNDLFRLLALWFLQPNSRLVRVDVSNIKNYHLHPIIEGCLNEGLIEVWSDELGKLLSLHDSCCEGSRYFIGVACESAFSGGVLQKYENSEEHRCFPLVGPQQIEQLDDAYVWDVPQGTHLTKVSFASAYKNCHLIGAKKIENPHGGSHHKVIFNGERPWVLDPNVDPIPPRFLRELVPITGLPLPVIITALAYGEIPKRLLRFSKK